MIVNFDKNTTSSVLVIMSYLFLILGTMLMCFSVFFNSLSKNLEDKVILKTSEWRCIEVDNNQYCTCWDRIDKNGRIKDENKK